MPTKRRQMQAEQTRQDILDAARRLFGEQGYARTTVAQIADAADVSVQTIYDVFGSKRAIVAVLNDALDDAAGIGDIARRIGAAERADEILDLVVRIPRALLDTSGGVIRIALDARTQENELSAILDEGLARHQRGIDFTVERLVSLGAVPAERTDEVTDLMTMWTDVGQWIYLVDRYGWTPDRVEAVARSALASLIDTSG